MSNKIVALVMVLIVAAAVIVAVTLNKGDDANPNQTQSSSQSSQNNPPPAVSSKKGIKQFTLAATGGSGVAGDGTITLKADLTSLAARLTTAPALAKDEKYEVYIMQSTSSTPVLAGEMFPIESKTEKFLWGGAGKVEWYDAKKIMITKRSPSQAKPGEIVAEGEIPAQGQAAN